MLNVVIIIPAYKPSESLVRLVKELSAAGFRRIIAVDDGSGAKYADIFHRAKQEGCIVKSHEKNRGKGAALKTGFSKAVECYGSGNSYITADSDGQHLPNDILRIAEEMERYPDALVLGTRDLHSKITSKNVPVRSRLGNSFST